MLGRSEPPIWLSRPRQQQFLSLYRLLDDSGLSIVELCLRFALAPFRSLPPEFAGQQAGTVLIGCKTVAHVEASVAAAAKGPLPEDVLLRLDEIAALVPFRPFEEPMIMPLNNPNGYAGPGLANIGPAARR